MDMQCNWYWYLDTEAEYKLSDGEEVLKDSSSNVDGRHGPSIIITIFTNLPGGGGQRGAHLTLFGLLISDHP